MIAYLWVGLGSALGGMARYGLGLTASRLWGDSFPWGTILINIIGSFVIGFFGALTMPEGPFPASPSVRVFVLVGVCGGFTTFSSFRLQTFSLARDSGWAGAGANVVLSVVLCLAAVAAGHYSADRIGVMRAATIAHPHRVLALLDQPAYATPVLRTAGLAAQKFDGSKIEALHLLHDERQGFLPTEEVTSRERQAALSGQSALQAVDIRQRFDAWQQAGGTGTWRQVAGQTAPMIVTETAGANLLVIGRTSPGLHAALFETTVPTMLVPDFPPRTLGDHIAIAWKTSAAARQAVQAALPLLRQAQHVTILTGDGESTDNLMPLLTSAGITANIRRFGSEDQDIGTALLHQAHAIGADLLVMGAYSRGRLAELMLGGATRTILASADLPVLMHH